MRATLYSSLFAAFLLLSFGLSVSAQTLTKEQLQKMYKEYLANEGFKPEVDADGDVIFKFEGTSYYISVDAEDQEFFRIMSTEVISVKTPEERWKSEVACVYATSKTKVAKAFISSDKVRFSLELFVAKPQDFKGVFIRGMSALQAVRKNFVEKLRG